MENLKMGYCQQQLEKENGYDLAKVINIKKRKYFRGNAQKIIEQRVSDEDFKFYCKYAILKYAKEKQIVNIIGVLESMYYHKIEQNDLMTFCLELFDNTYSLEEKVDKIIENYERDYITGFEPYII